MSYTQSQYEENKILCINYYNTWEIVDRLGVIIPLLLRTSREDDVSVIQRQTELSLAFRFYLHAMHRRLKVFFIYPVLFLSNCK